MGFRVQGSRMQGLGFGDVGCGVYHLVGHPVLHASRGLSVTLGGHKGMRRVPHEGF